MPTTGVFEPELGSIFRGGGLRGSFSAVAELTDSPLARIGSEITRPPVNSTAFLSNRPDTSAGSLPAAPAAIVLAVAGVLCVSLVRDRKLWLAAFSAVLCLSQAGLTALPQLAHHLCRQAAHTKVLAAVEHGWLYLRQGCDRLRADMEGANFIALLHHLEGIPGIAGPSRFSGFAKTHRSYPHRDGQRTGNSSALANLFSVRFHANNCLGPVSEQFVLFSPAFIHANLSRGPPVSA